MAMKLGERLASLGLVTYEQVGEALKVQQLHGARLGTNLVQLGVLEVDALGVALGAHLSVPTASAAELERVPERLTSRIPARVAEAHLVVPVAERAGGSVLVAMVDPHDLTGIMELERLFERRIEVSVAPELRLRYWLERYYGIARDNRFLRSAGATGGLSGETERRRVIAATPALAAEPGQMRLGRIVPVKRAQPVVPVEAEPSGTFSLDITVEQRKKSAEAVEAIGFIEQAETGEAIADAVMGYLSHRAECGLLLRVHGQFCLGWRAAPPTPAETAAMITVPLELPTALRATVESGTTFRGLPVEAMKTWHDRLAELLGTAPPRELLVVPFGDSGGVRAVIYTHTTEKPLSEQLVVDLEGIGAAVSAVLERRARG